MKRTTITAQCPNYIGRSGVECEGGTKEQAALRAAFGVGAYGLTWAMDRNDERLPNAEGCTFQRWYISRPLTNKVRGKLHLVEIATGTKLTAEQVD